jgi:hypothetical protein
MLITVEFDQPLQKNQEVDALVALATLAKTTHAVIAKNKLSMNIFGEALSTERIQSSLAQLDLHPSTIHSSLSEEENQQADEDATTTERVRPMGR